MQAIRTRFIGPTNHRVKRIAATAAPGRRVYHWVEGKGLEGNHRAAAIMFARAFEWIDKDEEIQLHTGQLADGSFVHVIGEVTICQSAKPSLGGSTLSSDT